MARLSLGWLALLWLSVYATAGAQEDMPTLRVLSSNGVRSALEQAQPALEAAIGARLAIEFSTAAALARRIGDGEAFDVAILTPQLIDGLVAMQKIATDGRRRFARTGVGVGARRGHPAGAITNLEDLERVLRAAESVAFTAEGQSRGTIDTAFAQLGITDLMQSKSMLLGPGEAPGAVASGRAELVLTLISEIVDVSDLMLLGAFPEEIQSYVVFEAGAGRTSPRAHVVLDELASAELAEILAAHGLETLEAR